MGRVKDETGHKYGRLTVLSRAENVGNMAAWFCCCDCGEVVTVIGSNLRRHNTQSCGCLQMGQVIKHGLTYHSLYFAWGNMKERVLNPSNESYHNYGGRGISVCADWLDFEPFYSWAKDKWVKGLDLDREDNDGNYEPDNCRFVNRSLSTVNRRKQNNNTSGYVGVSYSSRDGNYSSRLGYKALGGDIHLGSFSTPEAAVVARNTFIIKNGLPHKIQEIKCQNY